MGKPDWVKIHISRRMKECGMVMTVEATPAVEEFMANLGAGQSDPIEAYGRAWSSVDDKIPARIYKLLDAPDMSHARYEIDSPAAPFRDQTGRTNISFLRLVGISAPGGARFKVNNPISSGEIENLAKTLTFAARQFLRDYMTQANVTLRIVGGE